MTPLFDAIRLHKPLAGVDLVETSSPDELAALGPDVQVVSARDPVSLLPHEIEQIKAEAYAAGCADTAKQHEEEMSREREMHANAIGASLTELSNLKKQLVQEVEEILPELLIEGAGRLLARWEPDRSSVEAMVEELLVDFDAGDHVMRIHLNPTALETLTEAGAEVFIRENPGLEFIADSRLLPGESTLDGRFGLADARYSAKLKNLKEVLKHE